MRKGILGMLLVAGISLAWIAQGQAAAEKEIDGKSKPAVQEDIVGQWRMIYQLVNPGVKKRSPNFFVDHQVFEFRQDGSIKNISWSKPFDDARAKTMLEESWEQPIRTKYAFIDAGYLVVERSEQDQDRIIISRITKDLLEPLRPGAPLLRKDELILTYILRDNEPYMQRVLQRMK